jgi:hypothetical protein
MWKAVVMKSKLPIIIGCSISLIAVIAAMIVAGVYLFVPVRIYPLMALANTLNEKPYFVKELGKITEVSQSDEITVKINGTLMKNDITATLSRKDEKCQARLYVDGNDLQDFDGFITLDKDYLSVYSSKLPNKVIQYGYNNEVTGSVQNFISEEQLSNFNNVLKGMVSSDAGEDIKGDLEQIVRNCMSDFEFKRIGKDSFEVNGKQVKCKGYELKVTKALVKSLLAEADDTMSDRKYADLVAHAFKYENFEQMLKELRSKANDMDSFNASVYVYDQMIAAIKYTYEDVDYEIVLGGGDYRTQNIDVVSRDSDSGKTVVFRVKGTYDDDVEKLKYTYMDEELGTIEYDTDSGDFDFDFGKHFALSGDLEYSSDEVVATMDNIKWKGINVKPDNFTVSLSEGADFEEPDSSVEVFDFGTASQTQWEELLIDLLKQMDAKSSIYQYITKKYIGNSLGNITKNIFKW